MKLRDNLALWMFATSIMSWTIVVAITPAGGWCESSLHHEDYKTAFVVTGLMVLASIAFLMYNAKLVRNGK
jgi:hypothetical protein